MIKRCGQPMWFGTRQASEDGTERGSNEGARMGGVVLVNLKAASREGCDWGVAFFCLFPPSDLVGFKGVRPQGWPRLLSPHLIEPWIGLLSAGRSCDNFNSIRSRLGQKVWCNSLETCILGLEKLVP